MTRPKPAVSSQKQPRVFGFSGSFFSNKPLRRMLDAFGLRPALGWPQAQDQVVVWGRGATSQRGRRIAAMNKAAVVTVEDGFVRSVQTGRQGDQSHSFIIDRQGVYFECDKENDLKDLIAKSAALDSTELEQARFGIATLKKLHLSKYNDFEIAAPDLPDTFVLVVDQTFGDASIRGANSNAGTFQLMLEAAKADHPDKKIIVKTHPETIAGKRRGYFDAGDQTDQVQLFSQNVSPWVLFDKAQAVYCVSSQLGMEAIFAGHRPVVFGNAFYAGLGLTDDRNDAVQARGGFKAEQLFWAVYLKYCRWYHPFFNRETDFQTAAQNVAADANWQRTRKNKTVFTGMRLWKRGFLRRYFQGAGGAPIFVNDPMRAVEKAKENNAQLFVWAGKTTAVLTEKCAELSVPLVRVEDGFLRSVGLGAQLIEPVSLALDDLGIYYDPSQESRLERYISDAVNLSKSDLLRAAALRKNVTNLGVTKYNLKTNDDILLPENGHIILIPGQVEDDQSILTGASQVRTNLQLVQATRAKFPDSFLVFKPHPDVMAGLREGGRHADEISKLVNLTVPQADMATLLSKVDAVSTMTSLAGFEALLRGKDVVCYGAPFYAGWGLTQDLGDTPSRRQARPSLDALVHAALIDYAQYWDPVTGKPCPVEVIIERFERGEMGRSGRPSVRLLAKLQGVLASYAHLWR